MVVYSILRADLSPTFYCLPKPLLVYGSMLLLSTSILSSYSDQRKSYSGCVGVGVCVCVFSSHPFWTSSSLDVPAGVTHVGVGVGLGIAHGQTCLNAR